MAITASPNAPAPAPMPIFAFLLKAVPVSDDEGVVADDISGIDIDIDSVTVRVTGAPVAVTTCAWVVIVTTDDFESRVVRVIKALVVNPGVETENTVITDTSTVDGEECAVAVVELELDSVDGA